MKRFFQSRTAFLFAGMALILVNEIFKDNLTAIILCAIIGGLLGHFAVKFDLRRTP